MIKGLESLSYVERLKELFLLSLEKRRPRENPVTVFQHLWGRKKQDGVFHFTRGHMEKTKAMGTSSREKVSCQYKKEIIYSKNNH